MLFRRDTANGRVFEILSYELLNNSEIKAFAGLIIWKLTEDTVTFIRTGTHSDLF